MKLFINRAGFFLLLAMVAGGALAGNFQPALADDASPPNILLIYTDDQSHRSVGCYPEAHRWVRTPHIDRLAEEGVRFAPAYIGTNCISSRANLLSGRHSTGIQSLRPSAGPSLPDFDEQGPIFWPRIFREHGYHTAHIGKWHNTGGTGYDRDWDYQKVWSRLVGGREYNLNYQSRQLISTDGGEPKLTDGYSTDNYTRWETAPPELARWTDVWQPEAGSMNSPPPRSLSAWSGVWEVLTVDERSGFQTPLHSHRAGRWRIREWRRAWFLVSKHGSRRTSRRGGRRSVKIVGLQTSFVCGRRQRNNPHLDRRAERAGPGSCDRYTGSTKADCVMSFTNEVERDDAGLHADPRTLSCVYSRLHRSFR